jgi:hypothetical protein
MGGNMMRARLPGMASERAIWAGETMSAAASGMLVSRVVALLTAEEVDRAAAMKLQFDPPGS